MDHEITGFSSDTTARPVTRSLEAFLPAGPESKTPHLSFAGNVTVKCCVQIT